MDAVADAARRRATAVMSCGVCLPGTSAESSAAGMAVSMDAVADTVGRRTASGFCRVHLPGTGAYYGVDGISAFVSSVCAQSLNRR